MKQTKSAMPPMQEFFQWCVVFVIGCGIMWLFYEAKLDADFKAECEERNGNAIMSRNADTCYDRRTLQVIMAK